MQNSNISLFTLKIFLGFQKTAKKKKKRKKKKEQPVNKTTNSNNRAPNKDTQDDISKIMLLQRLRFKFVLIQFLPIKKHK